MGFLSSKKKEFLVIDFGSSHIKGFSVQRDLRNINKIEKAVVEDIDAYGPVESKSKETQNFDFEIKKKALSKILTGLCFNRNENKEVILSLPSDCLMARVLNVSIERENFKKRITKKEAASIFHNIFQESKTQILSSLSFSKNLGQIKFLRARLLDTKIAGYHVSDITGFSGKNFDFRILIIFTFKEQWESYKDVLWNFGIKKFNVFHEAEGLIKLDGIIDEKSLVLVDIGDKFTKFFIFKNKKLEDAGEFRLAGKDFTFSLQKKFKITDRDSGELKIGFNERKLTQKVEEKIKPVLLPVAIEWWNALKNNVFKNGFFSSKIVFFGPGFMNIILEVKDEINKGNNAACLVDIQPLRLDAKENNLGKIIFGSFNAQADFGTFILTLI